MSGPLDLRAALVGAGEGVPGGSHNDSALPDPDDHPQVVYAGVFLHAASRPQMEAGNPKRPGSLQLGQAFLRLARKRRLLAEDSRGFLKVRQPPEPPGSGSSALEMEMQTHAEPGTASIEYQELRLSLLQRPPGLGESDPVVYAVVTDLTYGRSMPFVFLRDIQRLHEQSPRLGAFSNRSLEHRISEFNEITLQALEEQPADPKVAQVQGKLAEVQEVVQDSLERVLERQPDIEGLVQLSSGLENFGKRLRLESRLLRQSLWWRDMRSRLLNGLVVLLVLFLVSASFCGVTLDSCI